MKFALFSIVALIQLTLNAAPALPSRGFVQEFDSVVQLLSTSPIQLSSTFTAKGLFAINDGLGGKFYYYPSDTSATNETDSFAWGTGRLRRFNEGFTGTRLAIYGTSTNYASSFLVNKLMVDARNYGVRGDYDPNTGSGTDDTAALQLAINNAGTGGIVLLPTLNYKLTGPISIPATTKVIGYGHASGYNAWPGGPNIYWTSDTPVGIYMTNRSSVIENLALFGGGHLSNVVETLNEYHQINNCQILGGTHAGVRWGDYANNMVIYNCDISHNGTGILADGVSSTTSQIWLTRMHYNTNYGFYGSSYLNLTFLGCTFEANGLQGAALVKQDGLTMDGVYFCNTWFENNRGGNMITTNISSTPTANVGTVVIDKCRWTEIGIGVVPGYTNGFSKLSSTYQFQVKSTVFGGPYWINTNVTELSFVDCPYIGPPSPDSNTNAVRFASYDNPGTDRAFSSGLYGAEIYSRDTNGLIRARGGLYISTSTYPHTNVLGTPDMLAVNAAAFSVDASGNSFATGTAFANIVHATNSITSDGSVNGAGGIIGALSIQDKNIGVNASPQGNLDVYGNNWAYLRPAVTNTSATASPDPAINGHAFGWNRSQGYGESVHSFSRDVGTAPALEIGSSSTNGYQGLWLFKANGTLQNTNGTFKVDTNALVTAKTAYLTGIASSNTIESVGAVMIRPGSIVFSGTSAFSLQHSGTEALIQTWNSSPFGIETAGQRRMTISAAGVVTLPAGQLVLTPMTKAQKTALTPQEGMIVMQSDTTAGLRVYQGGAWRMISTVADP